MSSVCHTANGHSVVDYLLLQSEMAETLLCEFNIRDMAVVSDHCPIQFAFTVIKQHGHNQQEITLSEECRYVWQSNDKDTYQHNLITLAPDLDHAVMIMIDGSRLAELVNNGISTFTKVILAAAEP